MSVHWGGRGPGHSSRWPKAAGGAFSPATLFAAGEQGGWYDPSDLTSMWQDSAGTTAAVVDSSVGKINDKSGRGNHLTQATAASRPILRLVSGKYYLEFDGVDDCLFCASMTFTTDKMSLFYAGLTGAATLNQCLVESSIATDVTNNTFLIDTANRIVAKGTGFSVVSYTQAASSKFVLTGQIDITGDLVTGRKNQVSQGSSVTDMGGTGPFSTQPVYVGRRANASRPWTGNLYGLVIRNALTADPAPTEDWLNAKIGAY